MKKLLIILSLFVSLSSYGQTKPFMIVKPAAASGWTEIRINFTNTSQTISTYNSLNPSNQSFSSLFGATGAIYTSGDLLDIAGASTGVTISTIATANWVGYSGDGNQNTDNTATITSGTSLTGLTTAGYQRYWYQYGTVQPARYDATKPQLRLSGLTASASYTIRMSGNDGSLGFTCKWVARVVGSTSPSAIEVDGDGASVTNYAEFTVTSKVDGTIDLWLNTSTTNSGDLAVLAGMIITKN